jgi:arsenate reductase-like glutaredoxin family protein
VYHNPNCGSSKNALALLDELGVDYEVVLYLKTPPDRATLERIVAGLCGPVEELVRKDSRFEKLGLDPDTYVGKPDAVVELLTMALNAVLWGHVSLAAASCESIRPGRGVGRRLWADTGGIGPASEQP